MGSKVPERIRLAVERLAVRPDERVLEIGCGSGVAAGLVRDRLRDGAMLAIDRSQTQIERAARRNQNHLASGRLALQAVDLACVGVGEARFDKAFAISVNLFWLAPAARELECLRQVLAPEVRLFLFSEPPRSRSEEDGPAGGGRSRLGRLRRAWAHRLDGKRDRPGLALAARK